MSKVKLTNTQKAFLPDDAQKMIEAGFLSTDLKITDAGRYYLEHLQFIANKEALVARATEKVAEAEEKAAQ